MCTGTLSGYRTGQVRSGQVRSGVGCSLIPFELVVKRSKVLSRTQEEKDPDIQLLNDESW